MQLDKDRLAAKQYFLQHVNQNTVFFHNLREKLDYLVTECYYEQEVLDQYSFNFLRDLFDRPIDSILSSNRSRKQETSSPRCFLPALRKVGV
ncbi:hypothetical protein ACC710_36810, partial [Rhizobium ruizarguesonis]